MQDLARALAASDLRLAPADGPLHPRDLVRCPLNALLTAGVCGKRHTAVWPAGAGRGAAFWPDCATCATGAAHVVRLRAGGWTPPRSTIAAEVLEPKQRAAKRKWILSRLELHDPGGGELAPAREIALIVPDDPVAVP